MKSDIPYGSYLWSHIGKGLLMCPPKNDFQLGITLVCDNFVVD